MLLLVLSSTVNLNGLRLARTVQSRLALFHSQCLRLYAEAKLAILRKGGAPLLVEADLKLARFVAGLRGATALRGVSEVVTSLQMSAELLQLPEDRLITLVEGAQVIGSFDSAFQFLPEVKSAVSRCD